MADPDLFETFKAAGLRTGLRRRPAAHRRRQALMRRLRLRTHHAHEQALRRPAQRLRHPGHHAGQAERPGRATSTPAAFQVGVHANGDVAIDMVLTRLRAGPAAAAPARRPASASSIARWSTPTCSSASPPSARFPRRSTPTSTTTATSGPSTARTGCAGCSPIARFWTTASSVAGASDYVPGPFEPLMAIQSMVTRKDIRGRVWGENQRITVAEALRVCTLHGAYASFEEKIKGSITRRQAGRLRRSWPRTRTRPIRSRSRTSGWSARWSAGRTVHPKDEKVGSQELLSVHWKRDFFWKQSTTMVTPIPCLCSSCMSEERR